MATITTEIRIDACVAATLHRWCKASGMLDIAVSSAIRVAAETLAEMLPENSKFESYADAASYLAKNMKSLNRRSRSGLSASLKQALLAEGRDEDLRPTGVMAHTLGQRQTAVDLDPTELAEQARKIAASIQETEQLRNRIEGKTVSDETRPVEPTAFAETEEEKRLREKAGFMQIIAETINK